ncbi:MAG: hypothetical protein LBD61_00785 [Endomicrobium sp.]|jgi:hypothetical protein|nr:hypothetical protein [Endomicrobium sp.]
MKNVEFIIGSENIDNRPMQPFDEGTCSFLNAFSNKILKNPLCKQYPDLISLGFWTRKANIEKLKTQYNLQNRLGRGLAFHITPANIPVNFAFSFFFSLLAGNANIVRIPSKQFPQISIICNTLREAVAIYPEIKKRTAFVSYPVNDEISESISKNADVRIIWGGDVTVTNIRRLSTKPRCIDIVFADRYSFCIIDGEAVLSASDTQITSLAEVFYNDTYLMDQNACSSPQIIFWQKVTQKAKSRFWNAVTELVTKKYDLQPAIAVDKYIHLCKDAITRDNIANIMYDGLTYRSQLSSLHGVDLIEFRGRGGYFYEYDLQSLDELILFVTEKYQTITYFGVRSEIIKEFVISNKLRGIDRIVPIGKAMDIGIIWDGYDLIRELSRIIICN